MASDRGAGAAACRARGVLLAERSEDLSQRSLRALATMFVDDGTPGETLTRVAELARDAVGADMAGVTLLVNGQPATGVFTDPAAPEIDASQYRSGRGPCLEAFRTGVALRLDHTEHDDRWPEFAAAAAEAGIRATISLPVAARQHRLGALNLYSRRSRAFSDEDAGGLAVFARHAGVVLANANLYWDARQLNEHLSRALESRATIDHAVGIVLAAGGRTPEEAFQVLVQASRRQNRKLRDIAAEIVERAVQRPASGSRT